MNISTKTILLVDDNLDILDAVMLLLEDSGYKVIAVDNGDYLENLNTEDLPDLIMVDMLLSGKDGRDIIQKLKSQKETKDIPIILNSAHPDGKSLWRQSGADDFIAKPFSIDLLLSVINRHLTQTS